MKSKKTGRYILLFLLRMTRILCFFLCCTLLFLFLSPTQASTIAYVSDFPDNTSECSSNIEIFGKVFVLDPNIIMPIAEKTKDILATNIVYLDTLTRTCLKFLTETFGAVAERLTEAFPLTPKYNGSASLA
ncbi:MAG: hypothetical protein GX303_07785 [Clostridiales bacterium]|nr:hypothetical protein [Clostridiales bacterium]